MIVTDMAIDRRTTVFVSLVLILVVGVYSYLALPRESNPEIVIPIISVSTHYSGVAPADMETLVTIPIERKLSGLADVKELISESSEGMSNIQIEFDTDMDIDTALQKVRDKVDLAKSDLPEDADDSMIQEINLSEFPIIFLSLTGEAQLPILTQFAKDLEEELETIKGVLDVAVIGGAEREIQIIIDPDRASAYGVSMANLVTLALVENVNTPAGSLELGEAKYLIRVPGEFSSAKEIEDLVVMTGPRGVVYLRDIGYVMDGFKDTTTISRLDGVQAVTLTVSKRAGENIIAVADEVRRVAKLHEKRMLPGMQVHITMDQSEDIRDMVAELENSILSGLILVVIIIFLFLGFYNAIFVALAIPVSMLITFTILYATDTSLNMVVLFSLMLSLGMLVDNGIVVVENIYRHIQMGKAPILAARTGAAEVAWPIIASTATTVAAFSPMFFWPGIWGEFMVFMPLTVSLALGASLFVGLIVNPALASKFMRQHGIETTPEQQRKLELEAPSGHLILRVYGAVLEFALNWRAPTIVLALTLLIVIGNIFVTFAHIEFVPNTEPRSAYIDVEGPEGANLESTDALIREIEGRVQEQKENLDFIIANVGSKGVSVFGGMGGADGQSTHIGRVTLDFPKLQDVKVKPSVIVKSLRDRFDDITGARITMDQQQEGPTDAPPINVEISGEDYNVLAELALKVAKILEAVPDIVDIQNDYDKGKPEIRVVVDREQALLLGLNTQFIGNIIQVAISGRKAGEYREGDEEYDVMVRFPKEFRQDLSNLQHMTLVNLLGQPVPFSTVAKLEHGVGLGSIRRINRKHTITVFSEVENRSGAEVLKDAQAALEDFPLPPGYTISFTGENEDQQEAEDFLSKAFIVALFLVALVLITQFNSLMQPLIIMTSVILSLAGVFLGLLLCKMPFSIIMSGIGCISLAGVVVNNGIVLIDFINQLRHRGLTTHEAILHGGMTRFRPVMLTAVTTILGLIPMAIGVSFDFRNATWIIGGDSSQWWGPMAIVVIFGLAFATLLTLIVVPVLYSVTDTWHRLFFNNDNA